MDRDLREIIALGQEAEEFLSSALGKYLIDRAATEVEDALSQLSVVDAEDTAKIRELQNIVVRHGDFQGWLLSLVQAGDTAYDEYLTTEE